MEESNSSVNQLDAEDVDVRLPPRKRLLAGLRRQNSESPPPPEAYFPAVPGYLTIRLRNLMDMYGHLGPEELVEASEAAAEAAVEAAAMAKALAEEKAAKAVAAKAAAKVALELCIPTKKFYRKDNPLRRGRPKKHVTVQNLYKKRKGLEKDQTDEEVARRLHRAMNSSSRLSKDPATNAKLHKYMKIRKQLTSGKARFAAGGLSLAMPYASEKNSEDGDDDGVVVGKIPGKKPSQRGEVDGSEIDNGEPEVHMMVRALEEKLRTSRKRGRIKQKKLSLSLCTIRDLKNSKEDPVSEDIPSGDELKENSVAADTPAASAIPSAEMAIETLSTWKLKDFNAPQCYAGGNILRSLCANPTITTGTAMVEVDQ